uniref:Uncharacterized protein n=1 Tax=Rhizophora mucronata TaxID=61149 RepID=A0A2P2PKF1_RHIMU
MDSSMAFKSPCEISSPLSRSLSTKDLIEFPSKAEWRWLVKLLRVSSPLKLKKTSNLNELVGKEEVELVEAMKKGIGQPASPMCSTDVGCRKILANAP